MAPSPAYCRHYHLFGISSFRGEDYAGGAQFSYGQYYFPDLMNLFQTWEHEFVPQSESRLHDEFSELMALYGAWETDHMAPVRRSLSLQTLPTEVLTMVFNHVGAHNVSDAFSLSMASRTLWEVWNDTSPHPTYNLLQHVVDPLVLPAVIAATKTIRFAARFLQEKNDMASMVLTVTNYWDSLISLGTPVKISWEHARQIQVLNSEVLALVYNFFRKNLIRGFLLLPPIKRGLSVEAWSGLTSTEVGRVRRAVLNLELVKAMERMCEHIAATSRTAHYLDQIYTETDQINDLIRFHSVFSEAELRLIKMMREQTQLQVHDVLARYLHNYKTRDCCLYDSDVCPIIKVLANRLTPAAQLSLWATSEGLLAYGRFVKILQFKKNVGVSLRKLLDVFDIGWNAQPLASPNHPHNTSCIHWAVPEPGKIEALVCNPTNDTHPAPKNFFLDVSDAASSLILQQRDYLTPDNVSAFSRPRLARLQRNICIGVDNQSFELHQSILILDSVHLDMLDLLSSNRTYLPRQCLVWANTASIF